MERVTISMSDEFAADLAAFMQTHRYGNRSEALRDLVRLGLEKSQDDHGIGGECLATLSYVFNHHTRELSKRLTDAHHDHHDLQVATMHVHLDHHNCLEVAVLRGDTGDVREFAKGVVNERGVRYGQVTFVPVSVDTATHRHGQHRPGDTRLKRAHTHTRPKS